MSGMLASHLYISYLVWLLFGDSIPICSFIFVKCFWLLVYIPSPALPVMRVVGGGGGGGGGGIYEHNKKSKSNGRDS